VPLRACVARTHLGVAGYHFRTIGLRVNPLLLWASRHGTVGPLLRSTARATNRRLSELSRVTVDGTEMV
jgi:hypothetical protein